MMKDRNRTTCSHKLR